MIEYLTHTETDETMPVWSPDGKSVVYRGTTENVDTYDLFSLDLNRKKAKQLTKTIN
jgi:Tol biopolymer transport system component